MRTFLLVAGLLCGAAVLVGCGAPPRPSAIAGDPNVPGAAACAEEANRWFSYTDSLQAYVRCMEAYKKASANGALTLGCSPGDVSFPVNEPR